MPGPSAQPQVVGDQAVLEACRRLAREAIWLGGDIPYPPVRAWRALSWSHAAAAWRNAAQAPGLYVHLPGSLELGRAGAEAVNRYLRALELEAALLPLPAGIQPTTVYIGSDGRGDLACLSEAQLERLLSLITGLGLGDCAQYTVELDPWRGGAARIARLAAAGATRLSATVPRPPEGELDFGPLEEYTREARGHGLLLDFDLVAGPDGLGDCAARRRIEAALAFKPDCAHLTRRGPRPTGPSQRAWSQVPGLALPHIAAAENLQLKNSKSLHASVLGLGFGASSHARFALRYAKAGPLADYTASLETGASAPGLRGRPLDEQDELRAYVARNLENRGEVGLDLFRRALGREPDSVLREERALARRLGALVEDAVAWRVPEAFADGTAVAAKLFYDPRYRL